MEDFGGFEERLIYHKNGVAFNNYQSSVISYRASQSTCSLFTDLMGECQLVNNPISLLRYY